MASSGGGSITASSRTYDTDTAWYVIDHSTVRQFHQISFAMDNFWLWSKDHLGIGGQRHWNCLSRSAVARFCQSYISIFDTNKRCKCQRMGTNDGWSYSVCWTLSMLIDLFANLGVSLEFLRSGQTQAQALQRQAVFTIQLPLRLLQKDNFGR